MIHYFLFCNVDSHALVTFEGDAAAVVPVERVARGAVRGSSNGTKDGIMDRDECFVTWSNKKRWYAAVFITAGMLAVILLPI